MAPFRFSSCFLLAVTFLPAQSLSSRIYGGSGSDSATAVTTDPAGNIYVAGTTTSFDLPLLHAAQSSNTGTQFLFSPDAGFTWKPLGNLPGANSQFAPLTIDPTNSSVVYAGLNGMVFKSTDAAQHFLPGVLLQPAILQILSIVVDPSSPSAVYAAGNAGLLKSTDGGATWANATAGLPAVAPVNSLALDPFHPNSLWASVAGVGYMSSNGAQAWSQVSLPEPPPGNAFLLSFVFDFAKPGVVYALTNSSYLLKSTDGGQTWSQLSTPFTGGVLVSDPVRTGHLYALSSYQGTSGLFYRSTDGGVSWQSFPYPGRYASSIAINPGNPNIIVAGSYRTTDGGETWKPTAASRDLQAVFARTGKGLIIATAPVTSDIFLAKFAPDGKTLDFATYFGAMGNETASAVQVDRSGNIWVAGSTDSFFLPVSKHALQQQLKGVSSILLAEFSPQGHLLGSTYLGGSQTDTVRAMRLDASGDPWIFGQTNSPDFPLMKGGPPPLQPGATYAYLAKVSASLSQILYSASIPGADQIGGMSIDASGDIVLTGSTSTSGFPLTAGVVHGSAAPDQSSQQAFVIKLNSSGNTIFSTYLGGGAGALPPNAVVPVTPISNGIAVTADPTGIYITGNTAATDFPITPGAYQVRLQAACGYPAFVVYTGTIGTIYSYIFDDVFVTKLSPDGKKLIYSTFLGGSCYDRPTDIAVTPEGVAFVTGETNSLDFPVEHPIENAPAEEGYKSFVSMLSSDGGALSFSSYLGAGSSPRLAFGDDGIVHVAGSRGPGAQSVTNSGNPPFVPLTKVFLANVNASSPAAKLNLTSALNAFSLLPGSIAAGEIVALTVPDFKPAHSIDVGLSLRQPLETTLGGIQVLFDGKPVPVMSIFSGKIVCIAPEDFGTKSSTDIQVAFNGALSNRMTVDIAPTAFGLLSANGLGEGLANARNQDGTLNSRTNPAKAGTTITIYFTGGGVPPAPASINFGPATIAPLKGFVPGIYAAYFQAPTQSNHPSAVDVTLYPQPPSIDVGSSSQTLTVYVE